MFLRKKRGKYWEIVESKRNKKTGKIEQKAVLYLGSAENIYKKLKIRK